MEAAKLPTDLLPPASRHFMARCALLLRCVSRPQAIASV